MSKKNSVSHFIRTVLFSLFLIGGLMMISTQDDEFEIVKNLELFSSVYNEINSGFVYELDPEAFMQKGLKGMLSYLDPYTVFIPQKDVRAFNTSIKGKYAGIGTRIFKRDGHFYIEEVYPSSPANKADIKAGDQILKIGDKPLQKNQTIKGMSEWMRGLPGSTVQLTVKSHGESQEREVSLIRQTITIRNTPYHTLKDGTLYIVLYNFSQDIADNVRSIIRHHQYSGSAFNSILLDLRFNPGGLLTEAVKLANIFLPNNTAVVEVKGRHKVNYKTYRTNTDALVPDMPVAILINEKTASASEIVSGALQDYDRAVILGDKSFGKGLVQNAINLKNGDKLKFTSARYYIPSGRCIQSTLYEKGRPTKIDSNEYQSFTTANGRIVKDGGGILPDLQNNKSGYPSVKRTLNANRFLFFYCLERSSLYADRSVQDGLLADELEQFEAYCRDKKIQFKGEHTSKVSTLKKVVKKDGLDSLLRPQLEAYVEQNQRSTSDICASYKDELQLDILLGIHRILNMQDGFYNARFYHDPLIKKGLDLLQDGDRYSSVLQHD